MSVDMTKVSYDGHTEETVTMVQKMFDKYDLDKNCSLSRSEFRAILVQCGLRDADARAIYAAVDSNRDGAVDMREFIRWLYNDAPIMDSDNDRVAQERMDKVHKHMSRGTMNNKDSLNDFFEFMAELKDDYKFATGKNRKVLVLEDNLRSAKKTDDNPSGLEKHRDAKLRDFFNSFDLNGNGKLTMSEFVGGLAAMGHDGDQELMADLFRAIDTKKPKTRVWDRKYHENKAKEEAAKFAGETKYLVPACEIFEKKDMKAWGEDRAGAIDALMKEEQEAMKELRKKRSKDEKAKIEKMQEIKKMEDEIFEKSGVRPSKAKVDVTYAGSSEYDPKFERVPLADPRKGTVRLDEVGKPVDKLVLREDRAANVQSTSGGHIEESTKDAQDILALYNELEDIEDAIESATRIINEPRFNYTETKATADGLLDFKEFNNAMKSWKDSNQDEVKRMVGQMTNKANEKKDEMP